MSLILVLPLYLDLLCPVDKRNQTLSDKFATPCRSTALLATILETTRIALAIVGPRMVKGEKERRLDEFDSISANCARSARRLPAR